MALAVTIEPGHVIHYFCLTTRQPKPKFAVVICVAPWHGVFLINSEPAEFVKAQPELLSLQLILEAEHYAFLSYDSYLDCSQFHGLPEQSYESVEIVGQLRPHEIGEVRLLVAGANTLAERHRQAVLASFPSV